MKLYLNRRRNYALIYMSIAEALLEAIRQHDVSIKDRRLIHSLNAIKNIYNAFWRVSLRDKEKRKLQKIMTHLTKKSKFIKDTTEFTTLFYAWHSLLFIENAFKSVKEISTPCAVAKYWICRYMKEHYHIKYRPDLKEKIITMYKQLLQDLQEEGFMDVKLEMSKYKKALKI